MLMYRPIVLRDIYRALTVQIYGKSMKICIHGNFGTLIQNDQDPPWIFPMRAAICNPKWPTLKMCIFHNYKLSG